MKWNKSLDALKEVFYDDSMDAFKEAIVNRTRKSTITPFRSWVKYTKRQPCTPMYGRLYHYAGNNPVRYIDPDGRFDTLKLIDIDHFTESDENSGNLIKAFCCYALGTVLFLGTIVEDAATGGIGIVDDSASLATAGFLFCYGWELSKGKSDSVNPTEHGKLRAKQAKNGDPNRNIGDVNKIKQKGKHYRDTETGANVYVHGDKVYIENENGQEITQFHNPKSNTDQRIKSGRWEPVYE